MSPLSLLEIVLGFAFLIFIHELGHFLVARWCGIRCPQFAVGMGQAVLAWRKGIGLRMGSTEEEYSKQAIAHLEKERGPLDEAAREKLDAADIHAAGDALGLGQTEYRLNWLPIGGYVKMLGQEDTDPNAKSKDPAAFGNKSAKARAAVLIAGIVMNLITGLVFMVLAFGKGVEFPAAKVGGVAHGSPAEKAGLQVGDEITAIGGTQVTDFMDAKIRVVLADEKKPLAVSLLRDGKAQVVQITPEFNKVQGMQTLGFEPNRLLDLEMPDLKKMKPEDVKEWQETPFGKIKDDKPKIETINGQKVADYAAFDRALQAAQGKPVQVGVKTAAGTETVTFTPEVDSSLFEQVSEDGKEITSPIGIIPLIRVTGTVENSPAKTAGLRKDDLVLSIVGKDFPTNKEFRDAIKNADDTGVAIVVERDGKKLAPLQIKPKGKGLLSFLGFGEKQIGVGLGYATNDPRFIVDEKAGATLKNHHYPRGSRLVSLGGEPVITWNDIQRFLMTHTHGEPDVDVSFAFPIVVQPNIGIAPKNESILVQFPSEATPIIAHARWSAPALTPFDIETKKVHGTGTLDSARIGILKTRDSVVQTYVTIVRLIQGSVGSENINGVIGIVAGGAKVAETGDAAKFFYLLGVISINLAVMNLLPIPVLDGGHLLFLAIEKITGKPLPEKAQTVAFFIGIALLGSLMLFATWNDLVRIFGH